MTAIPDTVDFTFAKAWQHAGSPYQKGDTIKVSKATAEKLEALGAGSREKPASADRSAATK